MGSEKKGGGASEAGSEDYAKLSEYAEKRRKELSRLFSPVVDLTDHYGDLICRVTNALGGSPPTSTQDAVVRDLMADVFDFMWEWRRPLLEGRLQVAYPLARRSYESLSLLSICAQDPSFADAWERGKKISNAEIRKALAAAPMAETEDELRGLYNYFSKGTHPNRDLIAYRYLGEGNSFVLGSIGMPDLVLVTDHFIKLVQIWFWFTAAVSYYFRTVVAKVDPSFGKDYLKTAGEAKKVKAWLFESFNKLLEESQDNYIDTHRK
ncbi:MAG: hypothetical protein KJ645_02040 [Planctomycetes bacterium]|nr:hypothetical protein [Planctomycetota bacterium]